MSGPHPYCTEHDQPLEWCAHYVLAKIGPDEAWLETDRSEQREVIAGRLLEQIFGTQEPEPGPPFTHTLKLPETEEEMAAEPSPSFTLEDGP